MEINQGDFPTIGAFSTSYTTQCAVSNVAPTFTGTFTTAGTVNDTTTTTPFANVTVNDIDSGNTVKVTITYTAANGTLSGTGLTGSAGNYVLESGRVSPATLTTELRALVFTPTANQVAVGSTVQTTFTLTPNDGTANGSANATTVITATSINNAPTIGSAAPGQAVNDTATVTPFSALTIADPDIGASETVTITLDTAAKGVFTAASLTASGFSTADAGLTYTHAAGTPAALQTAIRQLAFDPADNRVAAGSTETTTFTISVNDGVASAVTNNTTTVVSTSVNDLPVVSDLNGDIVTFIPGTPNAANDWIDSEYAGRLPGSLSDPDILGAGGYIQITRSTGPSAGSFFLWDDYHYTSDAGRTALGAGITIHRASGVAVATVDNTDTGQAGAALKITLTAAATDLDAAYIIKSLQFNSAPAGEYVFTLKVWDGFVFSNTSTFEMRSPAVVTGVSASTANGTYGVGDSIAITVTFDKSVDVSGVPQLTLETGSTDRVASYATGTGTSTLTFTYTVQAGDSSSDLDFAGTTALALNSGTIIDAASGADAILTLPSPSATGSLGANKALVIDGNAPTDIALSNASVSTSAGLNATVGTLSSTDDTVSDSFTYTLVAGDGDTDNGSFNISGAGLRATNAGALSAGNKAIRVQTTDAAGNTFVEQMTVAVTTNPTVTITSSAATVKAGDTPTITFTFSETPTGFVDDDITTSGGSLGTVTVDSGNDKIYTATFTPTASTNSLSSSILVAANTFKNGSNQDNVASNTLTIPGDTLAPTLAITSSASTLKASETATVTFTFSEDLQASFTWNGSSGDVVVSGGTLGAISGSGLTRTATFTPTASTNGGTASITVASSAYTDAAGNNGGAGTTPTLTFDTLAPTLAITSNVSALKIGETATVTFTFSEDPGATFTWNGTTGDVAVTGGTLGVLSGSGLTRSATFTPTASTNGGTASITVASGNYTDNAGNNGGAGTTPTLTFDTLAPTLAFSTVATDDKINATEDDSNVSISGTSTGADGQTVSVSVAGGTAKTATIASGGAWSVSLTSGEAQALTEGNVSITANVADAAGNAATQATKTVVYDKTAPTLGTITRATLSGPTGNSTFTIDVAYADSGSGLDSTSITTADITVTGPGAVGPLSVSGASFNAGVATYTVNAPTGGWSSASHAGNYTVALAANEVKDQAGNAVAANASAHSFAVSFNAAPVITSNAGGDTATIDLAERITAVTTVVTTDADNDPRTYTIAGADHALFAIGVSSGALSFISAPVYAGSSGDNTREVIVTASDGQGGSDSQTLTINILSDLDRDGTPDTTDPDVDGDGLLNSAEDPVPGANGGTGDGNGDGTPDRGQANVVSLPTLGTGSTNQKWGTLAVPAGLTISNVSNSAATGLPRNAKMPLGQFDFSINGVTPGASVSIDLYVDATLNTNGYYKKVGSTWTNIGSVSTVGSKTKISFSITDGGVYDSDGVMNGTIVDPGGAVVLGPMITSNGGATAAAINVSENSTTVTTIVASVPPTLAGVSYSLTGGADQAKFVINTTNGALAFVSAPDFENPLDLGDTAANNTYVVEVSATDSNLQTDVQTLTVTVTDVDENSGGGDGGGTTTDTDGVSDTDEGTVPGITPTGGGTAVAGDGNGDGVADSQQSSVTSVPFRNTDTAVTNPGTAAPIYVSLVADSKDGKVDSTDGNTASLSNVRQLDAPTDLPSDVKMPLGLISFSSNVGAAGTTETFSLYVDPSLGVDAYWKKNTSGTWVNIASAEYGGKVVTEGGKTRLDFQIKDGGEFDSDGKADGTITDPGAPGIRVVVPPVVTDTDKDQFPDALEAANGLKVGIKDNDVFTSAKFFAMQLYRDILYREAEPGGLAYWINEIDSGLLTRPQVAVSFLDSVEFQAGTGAIARLYFGSLSRLPDPAGMSYWMDQQQTGTSMATIAASFAASPEFTAVYGSLSDGAFIQAQYQSVLNRAPTAAEQLSWTTQLNAGASRGVVLLGLTESNEYKAASDIKLSVALDYLGLLGRPAEQAGFDYWVNQQSTVQTEITVIGGFIASTEYHDRFLP